MSKSLDSIRRIDVKANLTPMIDVTFLLLIFFVLTSKFKTTEGKIQSYLPQDKGLNTSSAVVPTEVRVKLLWYDTSGNRPTKDKHGTCILKIERKVFPRRQYAEDSCYAKECGQNHPSPDFDNLLTFLLDKKANYRPPPGRDPAKGLPVILDARAQVPFMFIVRALNACVAAGITDVTFAAAENPY